MATVLLVVVLLPMSQVAKLLQFLSPHGPAGVRGRAGSIVRSIPGWVRSVWPVWVLLVALLPHVAASAADVFVPSGATWKYFKGTQEPSDPVVAWREIGFDDSLWLEGPTGIGFGDGDDATVLTLVTEGAHESM